MRNTIDGRDHKPFGSGTDPPNTKNTVAGQPAAIHRDADKNVHSCLPGDISSMETFKSPHTL